MSISTMRQPKHPIKAFRKPHIYINGELTMMSLVGNCYVCITNSGCVFELSINQDEATHLMASIDQAREMLDLNNHWYRFLKFSEMGDWVNGNVGVQQKIRTIYDTMFDQETIKQKSSPDTGLPVTHIEDASSGDKTFFDDAFNITPMAIFFQHFVHGDPVQLRLFSDAGSGDESRLEDDSSSTSGSFGVALFKDCHLTPLGSALEASAEGNIEVGHHSDHEKAKTAESKER